MNRKMLAALIAVLIVIISASIYFTVGEKSEEDQADIAATKGVTDEDWQIHAISDTGMIALVPATLKQLSVELDGNARQTLDDYRAFEYTLKSFGLRLNYIKAKNDLTSYDYTSLLANMIKDSDGVTDFSFTVSHMKEGDLEGTLLKGKGKLDGLEMEYDSVVIVRGANLWEVTVSYNSTNEKLKQLAQDIISSVQIQ